MENQASGGVGIATRPARREEVVGLGLLRALGAPVPMHQPAPVNWSQNSIASAYVRWDFTKIGKERPSSKRRDSVFTENADELKWFQHHKNNYDDHDDRRYFIDYPIEFLRMTVVVAGKGFDPAGK